ncbi:hypothetical protein [Cytobacillus firmus]|uniref:hypothetical protein n=1 Tax=Cytobacillus firmus TaxID=1399 RepID=UPI0018CEC9CA|nr:hypothetical protein [Cytobacillus firmus]MBG9587633.1 hypothetical protein [Cytobacillus firmus]
MKEIIKENEMEKMLQARGFQILDSEGCINSTLVVEYAVSLGFESSLNSEGILEFSKNIYTVVKGPNFIKGDHITVREWFEVQLEQVIGISVALESSDDDGELEVFLHSENEEELSIEELSKLEHLGITQDNSLDTILALIGGELVLLNG